MGYLVFCNIDGDGNIIDSLTGSYIIPSRQYDYFFYTSDEGVMEDISQYKVDVINRELIRK